MKLNQKQPVPELRQTVRAILSCLLLFLMSTVFALLSHLPCAAQEGENAAAVPKMWTYKVVFEATGTYRFSYVNPIEWIGSQNASVKDFKIKTVFNPVYFRSDSGGDPFEEIGIAKTAINGTLVVEGEDSQGTPYDCVGPINLPGWGGRLQVAKALTPGYLFRVDANSFNHFTYAGDPCTGGYDAYPSVGFYFGDDAGALAATVNLTPLMQKMGKVIFNVQGPSRKIANCMNDCTNCSSCGHSLSWKGTVTFTLLNDTLPPYVRPNTPLKATTTWKVPTRLQAAHVQQYMDATGTIKLVKTTNPAVSYGQVAYKIADGKSAVSVNLPLNASAIRILKANGKLRCTAVVTGKDAYGTARMKTPVTITAP